MRIVVSVISSQLHWLACSGRVALITSFLDHGASPDAVVRTSLFCNTLCSLIVCMGCVLMFTQDGQGQTPMHFACQNGHVKVC